MHTFKQVPSEVWDKLNEDIETDNDLEYVDNFRAYRVSDGLLHEEYKEAERNGCCGFYESSRRD